MNTTVDRVSPEVAVLTLDGELDASNYRELIEVGRGLYADGVRKLVLDLPQLTYMSSSGIVALHSIAMIFRGQEPPDPEAGWSAIHAVGTDADADPGVDAVRLAGPIRAIDSVLERTGLKRLLPVYPDRASALGS